MSENGITRRDLLKGAGATLAGAAALGPGSILPPLTEPTPAGQQPGAAEQAELAREEATRAQRMEWWRAAKFGMFIHMGLYSVLGRHEWVMEDEAIPVREYAPLNNVYDPKPGFARFWARLAKQAGQRYMVWTTKHHEGFCNFDATGLTDYCAPKHAPGRDLVREYVEAARAEGLRVGFYYSLMDWHHPDGARCATDEAARKRFVEYTHGLIHRLMSNYGKIDVLWYDVAWPLTAEQWESVEMNRMVFKLQPEIVVNNRNKLPGDFSTPEQHIQASKGGQAWETCMTMNDSWGYQRADDNWKTAKTIVRNLIACVRDGGNYLLNIGPRYDGTVPQKSVRILSEVGRWMARNGETIYESDPCQVTRSTYASFTRKGNTLFMHVHFWPGEYVAIGGLTAKVKSARFFATGQELKFEQNRFRARITGLPVGAPDHPATTIALECDSVPTQDMDFVRNNMPRDGV